MSLSEAQRQQISWLTESTDTEVAGLRDRVGKCLLGQGSSWYQAEGNLDTLFDFLREQDLLQELADSVGDEAEGKAWLQNLADKVTYTEPEYDDNYGMYYRYDKDVEAYIWSADHTAPLSGWMSQGQADAQVAQQWAAWQQDEAAQQAPVDQAEALEPSAWEWDENWEMFYRLGSSGVYEYSYSEDAAHTRPTGEWLTAEQVQQQWREWEQSQQPAAQEPVAQSPAAQGPGEGEEQVIAIAQEMLDEVVEAVPGAEALSADELTAIMAEFLEELAAAQESAE